MVKILVIAVAAALFVGAASWGMGREAAYYRAEARI